MHNGRWWYWTPSNTWLYRRGDQWMAYVPRSGPHNSGPQYSGSSAVDRNGALSRPAIGAMHNCKAMRLCGPAWANRSCKHRWIRGRARFTSWPGHECEYAGLRGDATDRADGQRTARLLSTAKHSRDAVRRHDGRRTRTRLRSAAGRRAAAPARRVRRLSVHRKRRAGCESDYELAGQSGRGWQHGKSRDIRRRKCGRGNRSARALPAWVELERRPAERAVRGGRGGAAGEWRRG